MIHSLMSPLTPSHHPQGDLDARNGFFVETRRVRRTLNAKSCSDPAGLAAPNAQQILPRERTAARLKCNHFKRKYPKRPQDTRRATPRQEARRHLRPFPPTATGRPERERVPPPFAGKNQASASPSGAAAPFAESLSSSVWACVLAGSSSRATRSSGRACTLSFNSAKITAML